MHVGRARVFIVGDDPSVFVVDVAAIPAVVVAAHRHQRRLAAGDEGARDRGVVALEIRVAVQHQERAGQVRQRRAQRAAGAERPRPVEHIPDRHVPARAVAERLAQHLAEVPGQEDDVGEPVAAQQLDLVLGERTPGDLDERLGNALGHRLQARRQPARQDRDRQAHEKSTLVPSKSNRKRTSSRPAVAIAARSCRWFSE